MKCVNGVWYYRGRSHATLREALAAAWAQRPGPKKAALVLEHQSGRVKKVCKTAYFTPEYTTGTGGLQA